MAASSGTNDQRVGLNLPDVELIDVVLNIRLAVVGVAWVVETTAAPSHEVLNSRQDVALMKSTFRPKRSISSRSGSQSTVRDGSLRFDRMLVEIVVPAEQ